MPSAHFGPNYVRLDTAKLASSYDRHLRASAGAASENSLARSPEPSPRLRSRKIGSVVSQHVPDRNIPVPGGKASCLPSTSSPMLSWATRVDFPAPWRYSTLLAAMYARATRSLWELHLGVGESFLWPAVSHAVCL